MKVTAETIFKNGVVVTVDKDNDVCEAVCVSDNKIIYVGTDKGAEEYIDENTKIIDLEGRALLPGFIDSHMHFGIFGMMQGPIVDVEYSKAPTIEDIKDKIREEASRKAPGEWITLWGYDQAKLADGRHPNAADFDEAAPDNPVQCTRACGHMGVYNTCALEMFGIKDESGFLPGEVVMEDGKPSGLLKDGAHMFMNSKVVYTERDIIEGLKAADKIMSAHGVTSVHDAGPNTDLRLTYKAMEEGIRSGDIKTRIYIMLFDTNGKAASREIISHFIGTGMVSGFGNEHFRIGPAKIMLDGSSSGPSSSMKEPYSHDPDLPGIQVWEQEEIDEIVEMVNASDYQMTAHCLGDNAVEMMLNAYEKAFGKLPRYDARHRIEHCGFADRDQVERIKDLGLVPIPNPGFIELNGKDYNRYYGERVGYMFPCAWYVHKGIPAAIGSDCPVIKPDPMLGLWAATVRKDGKNGESVGEGQKIGIMDAIRMYTYNGAYASFEEDIKGSIEEGKLADLVVLSENILETPVEDLRDVKTDLTMIDGKIVYERK